MRFTRKFARSFAKSFARGFSGNNGGAFAILKKYYQFVFTGKASELIQKANLWYIKNFGSGGEAVDLQIKNTQVGTFDGIGSYVNSGINQQGQTPISFQIKGYLPDLSGNHGLIGCGGFSVPVPGIMMRINNASLDVFSASNSVSGSVTNIHTVTVGLFVISFSWSGIVADQATVIYNGVSVLITIPYEWIGNSFSNWYIGTYATSVGFFDGQLYYTKLDNKFEYNFQSGKGLEIKDRSGNGNHGTFTGGIEPDFWANKSEFAEPPLYKHGGSNVAVNDVAGTVSMLADPDGSNLDNDIVIDGDFTNWTGVFPNELPDGWSRAGTTPDVNNYITDINGACKIVSNGVLTGIVKNILAANTTYLISFDLIDNTLSGWEIAAAGIQLFGVSFKIGKNYAFIQTTVASTLTIKRSASCNVTIDNFKVQEVTAIPAYGEWGGRFKKGGENTIPIIYPIIDRLEIPSSNGYVFFPDATEKILLRRVTNGSYTTLFSTVVGYVDIDINYQWRLKRNSFNNEHFNAPANWMRLEIRGGIYNEWTVVDPTGGAGTNPVFDDTYTETKLIVLDNDPSDESSHFTYNNKKYNIADNLVNGTGEYSIRRAIGVDSTTDVDGNPLEYPPYCVWPSGNTFLEPNDTVLNETFDAYAELGVLKNPNEFDYNTLFNIDLTGIPPEVFKLEKTSDGCIKNMVVQDSSFYMDSELEVEL
jgi:hypothetical protein